jgi:hypothetical protein
MRNAAWVVAPARAVAAGAAANYVDLHPVSGHNSTWFAAKAAARSPSVPGRALSLRRAEM